MGFSHWFTLARPATGLRRLAQHPSALLSLAGQGIWEKLLEIVTDELGFEWLMIDATHCKVHQHAAGARGGNQAMGRTKEGQHKGTSGRGCAWYAAREAIVTAWRKRIAARQAI